MVAQTCPDSKSKRSRADENCACSRRDAAWRDALLMDLLAGELAP